MEPWVDWWGWWWVSAAAAIVVGAYFGWDCRGAHERSKRFLEDMKEWAKEDKPDA